MNSREQRRHRRPVMPDREWPSSWRVDDLVDGQTQSRGDRGVEVGWGNSILVDVASFGVGLAVELASFDSAPGQGR